MKLQLTEKLFSFIMIMMISISFLQAQCSGNKVRLCKTSRGGVVHIFVLHKARSANTSPGVGVSVATAVFM